MAKLKNPLLSLKASGTIARVLTFVHRGKVDLVEKKPEIKDAQAPAQLAWRHMFNKCVNLWHDLSTAEKAEWESAARSRHMTGYAWYISQCLRPNPGIYLPLQGGNMTGDIDMGKHRVLKLPAPSDSQEAVRKAYVDALETRYQIGARVYHDVHQSIPRFTATALAFNQQRYDTDTIHDPVTNNSRLTCKTAGKYIITANLHMTPDANGYRTAYIRLNGATHLAIVELAKRVDNVWGPAITTIYNLSINDYVETLVYSGSDAVLKVTASPNYSPEFMMQRIG